MLANHYTRKKKDSGRFDLSPCGVRMPKRGLEPPLPNGNQLLKLRREHFGYISFSSVLRCKVLSDSQMHRYNLANVSHKRWPCVANNVPKMFPEQFGVSRIVRKLSLERQWPSLKIEPSFAQIRRGNATTRIAGKNGHNALRTNNQRRAAPRGRAPCRLAHVSANAFGRCSNLPASLRA